MIEAVWMVKAKRRDRAGGGLAVVWADKCVDFGRSGIVKATIIHW
jgi:hypothetical protein